jgi:hypothetical protein
MDDPQRTSTEICGGEGTLAGDNRRTCFVAILLLGPALALAWLLIQGPVITFLRESYLPAPATDLLGPATPEAKDDSYDAMAFLPPGTITFDTLQADLDGDGLSERVLVFNDEEDPHGPGMGGVVVLDSKPGGSSEAYESRPPSEGNVTDAAVRDINADGVLELLIYKSGEDGTAQYLHIYQWDGSAFVTLAPHGGPLDGAQAFSSAYYPPAFKDLDMDSDKELVAYEDQPPYEHLKVLVYVWDGEAFVYDNLYIILGPQRPPTESS